MSVVCKQGGVSGGRRHQAPITNLASLHLVQGGVPRCTQAANVKKANGRLQPCHASPRSCKHASPLPRKHALLTLPAPEEPISAVSTPGRKLPVMPCKRKSG